MKKPNISNLIKGIKVSLSRHSPEILTGIGIAGMVTTTILAGRATPKALTLIEERKEELNKQKFDNKLNDGGDLRDYKEITKLKFPEVVKVTWKCYDPAAVTATASIDCLVGAS